MKGSSVCVFFLVLLRAMSMSVAVTGSEGDTLYLPCTYSVHSSPHSMCWGRGRCPSSKCSNAIIWTDGCKVTWRQSDRYQLNGNIRQGNVSLTITEVTNSDGGTYCCRLEVPGMFNDKMTELSLEIKEVGKYSTTTDNIITNESDNLTGSDVGFVPTISTISNTIASSTSKGIQGAEHLSLENLLPLVIVAIVLMLSLLLLGVLVHRCKYHQKKMKKNESATPAVTFGGLDLPQIQTVDNIYEA